jgi:hypothetical protein
MKEVPTSFSKKGSQSFPFLSEFFSEHGSVAKRLCTGLQIRVGRFDSGPSLHDFKTEINKPARFVRAFLCP